jgi:hypothetical protein
VETKIWLHKPNLDDTSSPASSHSSRQSSQSPSKHTKTRIHIKLNSPSPAKLASMKFFVAVFAAFVAVAFAQSYPGYCQTDALALAQAATNAEASATTSVALATKAVAQAQAIAAAATQVFTEASANAAISVHYNKCVVGVSQSAASALSAALAQASAQAQAAASASATVMASANAFAAAYAKVSGEACACGDVAAGALKAAATAHSAVSSKSVTIASAVSSTQREARKIADSFVTVASYASAEAGPTCAVCKHVSAPTLPALTTKKFGGFATFSFPYPG